MQQRSRRFPQSPGALLVLMALIWLAITPAVPPPTARAATNEWTRIGLAGTRVDALAVSPVNGQVIFAGTHGHGAVRSADSGATWATINDGLSDQFVNTLFPDPGNASVVLLGAGQGAGVGTGGGVYKSTDAGNHWTKHWNGHVNRLLQAPGDRQTVYAIGEPAFVRSTNGGLDWSQKASNALANIDLRGLAIHPQQPQTLLAGGTTEGGSGRLVRSTDGGSTWTIVADVGLPAILDVAYGSADGSIILLGTSTGLWRSTDSGKSWQRLPGSLMTVAVQDLLVNPGQPLTLFAGSVGKGVLVSNDGGATWSAMPGALATANVYSLTVDDASPRNLYAGTDDGVWRLPLGEATTPATSVDARIEIVWPHGGKPVTQATKVNVTAYLFQSDSLKPVACLYDRPVRLWRSLNNAPAELVATGVRRLASAGGKSFPVWDFNDVTVDQATNPLNKYIFRVTVDGVTSRSNVWVHGADARTIFPRQDVPTAVKLAGSSLDARIEIVWPHDAQGRAASVQTASLANLAVDVYNRNTLASVPVDWSRPVRLYGTKDAGVETLIGTGKRMTVTVNGLTYPRWTFDDVDVSAARNPDSKLSFRADVEGVETSSNVWIHGVDARTIFPQPDVPVVSCG